MLFAIFPKELESCVHTKINLQMFITALCIIEKCWKQPRCPVAAELIYKVWCIQIKGYLFSTKNKKAIKPPKDMEEPQMPITQ